MAANLDASPISLSSLPLPPYIADHTLLSIIPIARIVVVLFCCCTLHLLGDFISSKCSSTYRSLPKVDKIRWNLR